MRTLRTPLLLALTAALAMPAATALAGDFSYRYVEGGYIQGRLEGADDIGGDIKPDGYYLAGSVAVGDHVNLFGRYGNGSDSEHASVPTYYDYYTGRLNRIDAKLDYDFNQAELGVGLHYAVGDSADLITEAAAVDMRLKVKAATQGVHHQAIVSTTGGRLSTGVRFGMGKHFEGLAKVGYLTTGGDLDYNGFAGSVGLQAKFNKTWGVVAQYDYMDGTQDLTLGVRASF